MTSCDIQLILLRHIPDESEIPLAALQGYSGNAPQHGKLRSVGAFKKLNDMHAHSRACRAYCKPERRSGLALSVAAVNMKKTHYIPSLSILYISSMSRLSRTESANRSYCDCL